MHVVVLNPTRQIRATTEILVRRLPTESNVSITLLVPERASSRVRSEWTVTRVSYADRLVPSVRYPVPTASGVSQIRRTVSAADVVVGIDYDYLPVALATVLSRAVGTPVVVTTDALPGVSWSYGNRFVDSVAAVYTHTLGRLVFASADATVGLGEYLRDGLERFGPADQVDIIPNGVDTTEFDLPDTASRRDDSDRPRLLYVGRLDPVKGVDRLLKTLQSLREGGIDATLTVVGEGTRRESYEALADRLGVSDETTFVGYQSDVVPFYHNADVLVLPSRAEGQPTVLMEAQACGIPVVTTDAGGAAEVVEVGEVVSAGDPAALAEAVESVVATDEAPSRQARDHVVETLSESITADEYLELFQSLTE